MITAWRIVRESLADQAFSGDNALKYGARWNSVGRRVVYTAESASLATLEMLVQMRGRSFFANFVIVDCSFDESLVEAIDSSRLPPGWTDSPPPSELQRLGDLWIRDRRSAVLRVPSAVTRIEFNYLINPEHGDFRTIDIGEPRPLDLDVRLVT